MEHGSNGMVTLPIARRRLGLVSWWTTGCGLTCVVTTVACAPAVCPSSLTQGLDSPRHATIEVRNNHQHRINVSVLRGDGGVTLDVGHVPATANRGFRLPMPLNGQPVRFVVVCPVTGDSHTTPEIVWQPTQVISLSVGLHLPLTKLALR